MRRADAPLTIVDRVLAWTIIATLGSILALDLVTAVRLLVFACHPPVAHAATAPIRQEARHAAGPGSALRVESRDGPVLLTTGPSTMSGTARSGVDARRVSLNAPAKGAWIDAPARFPEWTAHHPIRVEQSGRILLDMDGATGIVRAEMPGVLMEMGCFALALAATAWWWVTMLQRDARKMTAASAAWHARHARGDDGRR